MGFNEMCAYLHSQTAVDSEKGLDITFTYDPHYNRYFGDHDSRWTLELSDRLRKKLGPSPALSIGDDTLGIPVTGPVTITLPPGTGDRRVRLQAR